MRIVVITSSYPRDPADHAGRFVRDVNAGLVLGGHQVTTLAPWAPGLPMAAEDPVSGPVVRFRSTHDGDHALFYGDGMEANAKRMGLTAALTALRRIGRAARRALRDAARHHDVALAHWLFPGAWWALVGHHGPPLEVVGVAHGGDIHLLTQNLAGKVVRARLRGRLRGLHLVTARGAELLAARLLVPPSRVHVGPMGIDPTIFRPDPAAIRVPGRIVAAGRLVSIKGFDVLVRAAARLGVELLIAGDGPERAALGALAASLGVPLALPGRLPPADLAALFQTAELVVVPSRRLPGGREEGTPVVAIEAWCSGAAVVGTATGGLAELLRPRSLCVPDDDAALAALIASARARPDDHRDRGASVRFDRRTIAAGIAELFH